LKPSHGMTPLTPSDCQYAFDAGNYSISDIDLGNLARNLFTQLQNSRNKIIFGIYFNYSVYILIKLYSVII